MAVRQFILDSNFGGTYKVKNDPIGWDSSTRQLKRHNTFQGVFPFMIQDVEFFGDEDVAYIENVFLKGGTEAEISITEYIQIDGKDEFKIRFEGVGVFGVNYKKAYKEGLRPFVKFKFEKSGYQQKIFSNMKTKVDLGSETSLNDLELGEIDYRTCANPGRVIIENNTYDYTEGVETIKFTEGLTVDPKGFAIPLILDINENEAVNSINDFTLNSDGSLFYDFGHAANIDIDFNFSIAGLVITSIVPITYARIELRTHLDINDLTVFDPETLLDINLGGQPNSVEFFEEVVFSQTQRYVSPDNGLSLVFFTDAQGFANVEPGSTLNGLSGLIQGQIKVTEHFPTTSTRCVYRYEAFERIIESITDTNKTFKSTVFDRRDRKGGVTDFENLPDSGKFAHEILQTGLQIRGIEDSDGNTIAPRMSLSDMFSSVKAKYNLGLGIERINRVNTVVVEELPHFYSGRVVVTAHNVTEPETDGSNDFTFSDVKVGYKKAELEIVNGLGDYNNKVEYKTRITSTSSTLDLISMERGDSIGIEDLRRKGAQFGNTTDHKDDKEVFTIIVVDTGSIVPDSFNAVPDTSILYENILDTENAYNGFITPHRNLLRSGDWLHGGLLVYPNNIVKKVDEDLDTGLVTTDNGEVFIEQSDIVNNTLLSPMWINRIQSGRCTIEREEFDKLEADPNGIFKWSPNSRENSTHYNYVWILDFVYDDHTKILEFTGLQVNLDSDRVNIIDPEGQDHNPDETEETEVILGGFEYEYEIPLEG